MHLIALVAATIASALLAVSAGLANAEVQSRKAMVPLRVKRRRG